MANKLLILGLAAFLGIAKPGLGNYFDNKQVNNTSLISTVDSAYRVFDRYDSVVKEVLLESYAEYIHDLSVYLYNKEDLSNKAYKKAQEFLMNSQLSNEIVHEKIKILDLDKSRLQHTVLEKVVLNLKTGVKKYAGKFLEKFNNNAQEEYYDEVIDELERSLFNEKYRNFKLECKIMPNNDLLLKEKLSTYMGNNVVFNSNSSYGVLNLSYSVFDQETIELGNVIKINAALKPKKIRIDANYFDNRYNKTRKYFVEGNFSDLSLLTKTLSNAIIAGVNKLDYEHEK